MTTDSAPPARDPHETREVWVRADVDLGIAAMVEYLQTIPGVRTEASCQGTLGEGGPNPYRAQVMACWPASQAGRLFREFDVTVLGENWGYLHPRDGWSAPSRAGHEAALARPAGDAGEWVTVPAEATDAMLEAIQCSMDRPDWPVHARQAWEAALAAAPPPPSSGVVEEDWKTDLSATLDYLTETGDAHAKEDTDTSVAFGAGMQQAAMHIRIWLGERLASPPLPEGERRALIEEPDLPDSAWAFPIEVEELPSGTGEEYRQNALAVLERLAIDPDLADWLEHFVVDYLASERDRALIAEQKERG